MPMKNLILIVTIVISLVAGDSTPTQKISPSLSDTYHSGSLAFTNDLTNQSATFPQLTHHMVVLSIGQIEYNAAFSLQVEQSIHNQPKNKTSKTPPPMIFWVNITIQNVTVTPVLFKLRIDYLVVQRMLNIFTQVVNITYASPKHSITAVKTYDKNMQFLFFVRGFSNNLLTQYIQFQPMTADNQARVFTSNVEKLSGTDWVEVTVIVTQFDKCNGLGSVQFDLTLPSESQNATKIHSQLNSDLFSIVGLSSLSSSSGNFSYSPDSFTVNIEAGTTLDYSILSTSLSCVALNQSNKDKYDLNSTHRTVVSDSVTSNDSVPALTNVAVGTVSGATLASKPESSNISTSSGSTNLTNNQSSSWWSWLLPSKQPVKNGTATNKMDENNNNNSTQKNKDSMINITRSQGVVGVVAPTGIMPIPILRKDDAVSLGGPDVTNNKTTDNVSNGAVKASPNTAVSTNQVSSNSTAGSTSSAASPQINQSIPVTQQPIVKPTNTQPTIATSSPPSNLSNDSQQPQTSSDANQSKPQRNKNKGGWVFFGLLCALIVVIFAWLIYECIKECRFKMAAAARLPPSSQQNIMSEPVIIAAATQPRVVQITDVHEQNLSLSGDPKEDIDAEDLQSQSRLRERMNMPHNVQI